ncbi:hypothetical protein TeGR_g9629 [Tetraparma gracilis]|uniref:Uncharacterized protein n=1 Tax=Tetraparma gracilis TaxID=2962635 RepID=A0ABQ6MJX8_9STRA|nr:hypothetical protein TeGR_g9629 [Tetraparma gracilis]
MLLLLLTLLTLASGRVLPPPPLLPVPPSPSSLVPTTASDTILRINERLLSISGEDFIVRSPDGKPQYEVTGSNKVPFGVGGLVLDKLELRSCSPSALVCSVERRLLAAATAYDIYVKGSCVAKIERDVISLTPSYKFFYEADRNGVPAYRASGNFGGFSFSVAARHSDNKLKPCANIGRDIFELSNQADGYTLVAAPGCDPAALVALCVVIDEDRDEADARKRSERGGGKKTTRKDIDWWN